MPDLDPTPIDYSFGLPPEKRRLLGLTQFQLPLANSGAPRMANPAPLVNDSSAPLATAPPPKPTLAIQPQGLKGPALADQSYETALASSRQRSGIPTESSRLPNTLAIRPFDSPAPSPSLDPSTLRAPADARYNAMLAEGSGVSRMHGVGGAILKGLDVAGSILAPGAMASIPGTTMNYRLGLNRELGREKEQAGIEDTLSQAREREGRLALDIWKTKQPPKQERPESVDQEIADAAADAQREGRDPNTDPKVLQLLDVKRGGQKLTPDEGAIADLQKQINPKTGKPYSAYEARVKVAQDIQDTKPAGHTSPFEAFAYGTPEEKKSAQDFLAFEKRMGAQYQKPTEAEFRYSLYQRDPEGYKAVFGDKAAAGDRAHATKMLTFFQKQRNEISKNFMLGDDEKAQQLQEIDEMEQPFMDIARGNDTGGSGDRVNVTAPDGTPGTIPRSQLGAARRKGYRVAQ
jgi:hypothetical protein